MRYIHINCDLGEGGKYDKELMPLISACNIACGGHAGNLDSMQHTVGLALANNVEIGAHPSYPDKKNFGRISIKMDPIDLKRSLVAQILSLKQITEAEGAKLTHVKPHGALYNDAQRDKKIAEVILEALNEFDDPLLLFVPENSVISSMAEGKFQLFFEAFADRNYNPDHTLVTRLKKDALITQKEEVYHHLSSMVLEGEILCINGEKIPCKADTFCLHSDTPDAVEILHYLHRKFEDQQVNILPVS